MGSPGTDKGYQSLLARRGYNSLSPAKHRAFVSSYQPGSTKYSYLAHTTNESQQILKEIISTERKIMQRWPDRGYGGVSHSLGETTYSFFHKDFAGQSTNSRWRSFNAQPLSPYRHVVTMGKSYVRNRSYDPVLGHVKEFNTPTGIFQAFGTNKADFYASNGMYRAPSIAYFQGSLRR